MRPLDRWPPCDPAGIADPGKPIFFPQRESPQQGDVSFGVSLPKRSFLAGEHIPAYIWIDNRSDKGYETTTCGMFTEWNVAVWDQAGERLPDYAERNHLSVDSCSANGLIHVKAHSCMLANELPLDKDFDLPPGKYRLGELPWPIFTLSANQSPAKVPAANQSLLFNVSDPSPAPAATPALQRKPYVDEAIAPRVFGRVVRSDNGAPIPAVRVILSSGAPRAVCCGESGADREATTDSNGDFALPQLPDGTYIASAFADGFVTGDYHCTPGPKSVCKDREQQITSSSNTELDFRLLPEAVIHGKVVTTDGKPAGAGLIVTAVPVSLLAATSNGVYSNWSQATTDATGTFRLGKLPPASYLIRVRQEMGSPVPPPASEPRYHEAWFGNTPTPKGAVPVDLKAAEDHKGVRIVVPTETRHNIVLWLTGPDGLPPPREYIVSMPDSNSTARKQPDGSYLYPNVSPGHYKLWVFAAGVPLDHAYNKSIDVDVTDTDATLHVNITAKPSTGVSR